MDKQQYTARQLSTWIGIGLTAFALGGCAPAAVGDWQSAEEVGNDRNEMQLDDAGMGTATIYFFVTVTSNGAVVDSYAAKDEFEVQWTEEDNGDLEIEMSCTDSSLSDGPCPGEDFTMSCRLRGEDDELRCDGDGLWDGYDFEWERVE